MTYEDDDTREAFHLLPTGEQIAWLEAENVLASEGYNLHIEGIVERDGRVEVSVGTTRGSVG